MTVTRLSRYTCIYLDGVSGLYQMGARYYNAGLGRFTQQDALGSSVFTANRYAYADCNPANATDPTGLITFSCLTSAAEVGFGIMQIAALQIGAPAWVFNFWNRASAIYGAAGILGDTIVAIANDGITLQEGVDLTADLALFALELSGYGEAIQNKVSGAIGVAKGCFGYDIADPYFFYFGQ